METIAEKLRRIEIVKIAEKARLLKIHMMELGQKMRLSLSKAFEKAAKNK